MILDDVITDIDKLIWSYIKRNSRIYGYLFDSLEDMHSECMVICIKRFSWFDETKGALSNYVYMCCKYVCSNKFAVYKRHNGFEQSIGSLDEPVNPDSDIPLLDMIGYKQSDFAEIHKQKTDNQQILNIITRHICPELKEYLNGKTMRQIGQEHNVSKQCIAKKICRNRRKLRKILERIKDGSYYKLTYQEARNKIMLRLGCAERTAYRILNRYVDQGKVTLGVEDILRNLISKEDNYGKQRYSRKRNS